MKVPAPSAILFCCFGNSFFWAETPLIYPAKGLRAGPNLQRRWQDLAHAKMPKTL